MQKSAIVIFVLLVLAVIVVGGIVVTQYTEKGKDLWNSFSKKEDTISQPVSDSTTSSSSDYYDTTKYIKADPAIIADTAITGNISTDCLKELYGKDILRKIDEGRFTAPDDMQEKLSECIKSKMKTQTRTPAADESPLH